jgi:hypothetical protein
MEIAANPAWGNVVDPEQGVDFLVTMVPGSQSRSGWNTYTVLPEPQRASEVFTYLKGLADWPKVLDDLDAQKTAFKEPAEITSLLQEIGFPPLAGAQSATSQPTVAPKEEEATTTSEEEEEDNEQVATSSPAEETSSVHYDPGAEYTPKYPESEHPEGAPRCWGDYKPDTHDCAPCPVVTGCQMKHLKIDN